MTLAVPVWGVVKAMRTLKRMLVELLTIPST
jgi:hypothetical protein